MGEQIKVFVAACFYYSGLVKLARWWTQRSERRLIILNYHGATGGDLRRHLLYLRRHYRMLHLEEALEELYGVGNDEAGQAPAAIQHSNDAGASTAAQSGVLQGVGSHPSTQPPPVPTFRGATPPQDGGQDGAEESRRHVVARGEDQGGWALAGARHVPDRRTPLVLTFDDGYRDNYTDAFALARELQVPITIFLVPGYVESGDHFWWFEAERLTRHTQVDKMTLEGRTYHLQHAEERKLLAGAVDAHLRSALSVAEREAFLAMVREALAVPAECMTDEEAATLPLTWTQIREMEESGWVTFGAHTMYHPILAKLTDPTEVRHEIGLCRTVLEQRLGHPIRTFAYPFGQPEEVSGEASRATVEAGYEWVLTTVHGINTPQSDPHQLRRIFGDVSRHWLMMAAETSGMWKFFSLLWKKVPERLSY